MRYPFMFPRGIFARRQPAGASTHPERHALRRRSGPVVEPLGARIAPATLGVSKTVNIVGDSNGLADPGETLHYTITIAASGGPPALTGVELIDLLDPNTTLVPGSLHASPLAFNDTYYT